MSEPEWWEKDSPDYDEARATVLVALVKALIQRDIDKSLDALVIACAYADQKSTLIMFGPEESLDDSDGVETWSYRLEGDGFKVELFETHVSDEKSINWNLDFVEGGDEAVAWLRLPPDVLQVGCR